MNHTYNDNTERPKPKKNRLGILGISSREFTHSVTEIQQRPSGPRERCWGYVSIFENTPKSCGDFTQGKAQLEHSSHIVNVGVEATC